MIDIYAFCKIADSVSDNHVSPAANSSHLLQETMDRINESIRICFDQPAAVSTHCRQLKAELIFSHVIDSKPLHPYYWLLDRISIATAHQAPKGISSCDNWEMAIQAAIDYTKLQPHSNADQNVRHIHARQFAVAEAAFRLRQLGFRITTEKGRARMDIESERLLTDEIENLVRKLGGIGIAHMVFHTLESMSMYDCNQERFHFVRKFGMGNTTNTNPPLNHLLLLAAKHPYAPPQWEPETEENWQRLVNLTTDFAALFDVQPYGQFELMFKDAASILPFLQEIAIYDSLFTIPQVRPTDAIKIARGVLDWLDMKKQYDDGWSISEVLTVAKHVLEIGKSKRNQPSHIEAAAVAKKCKQIGFKHVSRILKHVLSHSLPETIQDNGKPTDSPGPDFSMRPLLPNGCESYWLLHPSVCAPAVIEALFSPLRKTIPDFDKNVGIAMERFLRQALEQKGVNTCAGNYKVGGMNGQCDIVIETSKTVIFIEVKKKPLTRKARAGSDVAILIDLAGSLLEAQLQAGWHEVRIREHGYIDLIEPDGRSKHLSLDGRGVERIAVSLFDYGGFQDRILLEQFFEANLNITSYSTGKETAQKKINELNESLVKLHEQLNHLIRLQPQDINVERHPFFNCWFLSLPQILVLLDCVKNGEDFREALCATRHVWTGSLDFYFEHANMKMIRNHSTNPT
jgi:hypothetical protein